VGERADAVRNRAAVLTAAEALFRQDAPVTLARVAEAAGVGKATVLRRFGDLNGLVEAVLAPKVAALLDFVLDNRTLIRALEHRRPHAYYANPASRFWIGELSRRLHAARPDEDADYLAHAVFTAMRADVIDYLNVEQGMSTDRIRTGLHALVS
jgi:AcrR family transcriptional regulator